MIKEISGTHTKFFNYLLPLAARVAFKQPTAISVVNAEAAMRIAMSGATGGPAIARRANVLQSIKNACHGRFTELGDFRWSASGHVRCC